MRPNRFTDLLARYPITTSYLLLCICAVLAVLLIVGPL